MTTATRRPLTIEDLTRLKLVGTPQLSPDGTRIAYPVATIHATDEENGYRSCDLPRPRRRLRRPAPAHRRRQAGPLAGLVPRWRAARLRLRSGGQGAGLYHRSRGRRGAGVDRRAARRGEPAVVARTARKSSYTASVGEEEQGPAPKGYKPPLVIKTLKHKFDGEGYFDAKRRHLFVIPAEGGEARQITAGDWNVGGPAWSPDVTQVAYTANQDEDRDRAEVNDLYVVAVAEGGGERPQGDARARAGRPAELVARRRANRLRRPRKRLHARREQSPPRRRGRRGRRGARPDGGLRSRRRQRGGGATRRAGSSRNARSGRRMAARSSSSRPMAATPGSIAPPRRMA